MFKALFIGDLHFSDVYVGHHKDYWGNCLNVAEKITRCIVDNNITHLFLAGDIVGYKEKNFRHRESLLTMLMILQRWNNLTNNHVYSLIGNHDIGGSLTDFGIFESMGLIKTSKSLLHEEGCIPYLDLENLRLHFIDYGQEELPVTISSVPSVSNVALTHADIQVDGKTTWWHRSARYFELSTMENWYGIELILGGHIHNPSEYMVSTSINGKAIDLLYMGNPTRPNKSDTWDNCWNVILETRLRPDSSGADISMTTIDMNLVPHEKLFDLTTMDIDLEEVDEQVEISRVEELADVLDSLSAYKLDSCNDIESQIKRFSGVDTEAMNLALKYLEKARLKEK